MKRVLNIAILAMSCIAFTSCSKYSIRGEGSVLTETRTLGPVNSVTANGDVDVQVYASNENKVEVTGYQNLISVYETRLSNGRLTLEFQDGYINVRNNNIRVKVYSIDINNVRLNGSGDIHVNEDMNTTEMEGEVNGSGKISFGDNSFDKLSIKVNGSGEINAKAAASKDVFAEVSGSGEIDLTATRYLKAKISGSGEINYWGNPENGVDKNISGSGEVNRRD